MHFAIILMHLPSTTKYNPLTTVFCITNICPLNEKVSKVQMQIALYSEGNSTHKEGKSNSEKTQESANSSEILKFRTCDLIWIYQYVFWWVSYLTTFKNNQFFRMHKKAYSIEFSIYEPLKHLPLSGKECFWNQLFQKLYRPDGSHWDVRPSLSIVFPSWFRFASEVVV